MVTDFEELVSLCDEELRHREYESRYYNRITRQWASLREWMNSQGLSIFDEAIGNRYCDEKFGTHIMPKRSPANLREKFRAIRMLISYQKNEVFEFRCPSIEYVFSGAIGESALRYLEYCRTELCLAEKTIENKRLYLYNFCKYVNIQELSLDDISIDEIERFFLSMNYSLSSRHNAASCLKLFFQFIYNRGESQKDCSIYILPDRYDKKSKLPTTYEEDEIKAVISSVERASAIGKRDYLVLLLAAEYGWRAQDITNFTFNDIDWDNNIIHFNQHKTDIPVDFPLLSSIGNAIIDYLKNGRPETDTQQIIVSHENANKGRTLSSPTIHSIVSKYINRAGIKDWKNKKHGPHALRHSLATNMLRKNISMPVINTVLGHQSMETTRIYISVDYDRLKKCVLKMPPMYSPYFKGEQ